MNIITQKKIDSSSQLNKKPSADKADKMLSADDVQKQEDVKKLADVDSKKEISFSKDKGDKLELSGEFKDKFGDKKTTVDAHKEFSKTFGF